MVYLSDFITRPFIGHCKFECCGCIDGVCPLDRDYQQCETSIKANVLVDRKTESTNKRIIEKGISINPIERVDVLRVLWDSAQAGFCCPITKKRLDLWARPYDIRLATSLDHRHPLELGGGNEYSNLWLMSHEANVVKGITPLKYFISYIEGIRRDHGDIGVNEYIAIWYPIANARVAEENQPKNGWVKI